MNLSSCQNTLITQYLKDPYQKDSLSVLTRDAWWKDKWVCTKIMGGSVNIRNYLEKSKNNVHNVSTTWTEQSKKTSQIVSSTSQDSFFPDFSLVSQYVQDAFLILLYAFVAYFFFKMLKYLAEFIYDVFNASRVVYLKVLLPRGDDKISRENSKDVAKDMKEKIGRIAQVYDNIHKLWDISFWDNIMHWFFNKPKVTLMLHYEHGLLHFILGVYPEYQKLVEGAISAQFSEASIENTTKPKFFAKKYSDITVMEPQKDPVYPIKMFKLMQDDPLNNLIDGMGKVSSEDTFTIVIPIKPIVGDTFNKKAKFYADALYKKQNEKIEWTPFWKYLIFPWKIIDFLISGPSKDLIESSGKEQEVTMVRMIKAQEDSINAMGEEAWKHAFLAAIMLTTSSDDKQRVDENINNMIGTFTIYRDEYGNELDENNFYWDILGFVFKPLWKFALSFNLPQFFFKANVFTPNALGSLFHFPDGVFNRSPIIKWMDYKVLAAPDNLPVMKTESGFIMTWIVAEEYRNWVLSDIIAGSRHWAVGQKMEKVEKLVPIEQYKEDQLQWKNIKEQDGKKFVIEYQEIPKWWYKIFKEGVLLGVNIYRNNYTPVYMKRNDRTRHHYIIWKSWGWKSVFIGALARQDVWNGDGLCVIDPHGDLVEGIMEYIPKERAQDVVYFDAGNEDRPMGLNLYDIDNIDQADRTVNDATEIFIKMFWAEVFGPRIQEYFKYGSLTLLEDFEDKPTLLDVPRLFTDDTYREYKTKKVTNPVVRNFWEKTYNAMGDREKQEIIPYFTSKFVSFNTNRLIRNIIGQTKSGFKFRELMDSRKILLINLSKGKIWEINAQLLGMVLVSQIYNGAMSRANIDEKDRVDFYLYVDEFQNFVSGTFADILSEARKYRLGMIMAHQYIAQLESWNKSEWWKSDVKAAVFGNVGTLQSFKVGAPDAEFLEKEYAPVLSAQDIVGISNYKAYIKLNIDNSTSRVFSMNTLWTQDYKSKKIAEVLKEYSAKKYGRKREFVDAEIQARLGLDSNTGDSEDVVSDQSDSS